jgi:hypothetical protein
MRESSCKRYHHLDLPDILGGVLGGLGAAKVASASKVKPPTGAVEDVPGAGMRSAAQSGFSPAELGVIREARSITTSPHMADLAAAHGAGEPMTVRIGGRLVQYEPSMPAPYSGMSLFGENGFLMGPQAFSSNFEHNKTVLHELHRLNFSKSADGVFADLAARETNAARDFANRAVEHLP